MWNRLIRPATVAALVGAALGASAALYLGRGGRDGGDDPYDQLRRFGDIYEKVRANYVDEPDGNRLIRAAIHGMVASLDPHSGYVDGAGYRAMQARSRGEYGEAGIEVAERNGAVVVVSPIEGSAAAKAGVLAGDVVAAIDGKSARDLSADDVDDQLHGAVNSSVSLTLLRQGEPLTLQIVRDVVKIKSVRARVEAGDVGYIRIAQFTETTVDGLRSAVERFRAEIPASAFRGYVLDLRNNPGGYVDQAIDAVNAFIRDGLIVATRGRGAGSEKRFEARPEAEFAGDAPLIVLINGGTASAAEIVAGALQDRGRAKVLGTRSFGKGSVQATFPLGDQGALHLTIARYYTPSGKSIQARGIAPDIEVLEDVPADAAAQSQNPGEASLKGHLGNGDESSGASQAYVPADRKADRQLDAAIAVLTNASTRPDERSTP